MDLRATTSTVGDHVVVAFDGTADLAAAPVLHTALGRAAAQAGPSELVVDLDGLTVLDDVAIGLLVGAAARQREAGGDLVVVCTNARLLDRLARTRIDRIITVRSSIAAPSASG